MRRARYPVARDSSELPQVNENSVCFAFEVERVLSEEASFPRASPSPGMMNGGLEGMNKTLFLENLVIYNVCLINKYFPLGLKENHYPIVNLK